MNNVYTITDLNQYALAIREQAIESIADDQNTNWDDFITVDEVIDIVACHSLGCDNDNNHMIDEETHNYIMDDLNTWIINIGLAKLAGANKIECAWDDSVNEMVFWKSDNGVSNANKQTKYDRTKDGDRPN